MEISRELFYSLQHIEAAATTTQDPNPLHRQDELDQHRDHAASGPVALGFQIATLFDSEVSRLDESCALNEDRHVPDPGSDYCDIRFLRPVHTDELMRLTVKRGALHTDRPKQASLSGTTRILLSGESGIAATGLRRTSDEAIGLPAALTACGLDGDVLEPSKKDSLTRHYQQEQIHGSAGRHFLQASLGSNLDAGQAVRNPATTVAPADTADSCVPKMYPVALSSKVLASCPALVDLDLNRKSLVYSRLKIHINGEVSNTLKDGDSLDYIVSRLTPMVSNQGAMPNRIILQVLSCTANRQLVFRGTYTLSIIDAMHRTENRASRRNKRCTPEIAADSC